MRKVLSMMLGIFMMLGIMPINVFAATQTGEMRAVWIATVGNIHYPATKNNPEAQKEEYIQKLDQLKEIGINTVIFQVRAKADATYPSLINPWAESLTGNQGQDPGYDPLAFMIEETHKRGMEFHAWLNPYRITTSGTDLSVLSPDHPARLNPSLVIAYNNALYYNPELTEVKDHVVATVEEIVKNYNVDGIHFDDYFYPSNYPLPEGEGKDGFVANSRRGHVNDMVARVSAAVKKINKKVQFGISPIGIWKNSTSDITGSQTGGNESYYSVYGDSRAWIQNGWLDYIVPQIYWETTHKTANYETLVEWWSNEVRGTNVKLYIGQGIYKDVVAAEIDKQLEINKKYSEVKGSFYYAIKDLLSNRGGCKDKIKKVYTENPTEFIAPSETIKNETMTGIVTADSLNIRAGAGTQYPILTKLAKGTKVTILASSSGWYQVELPNGSVGWANMGYVSVNVTSSTNKPLSNPPKTASQTAKIGTVTASTLNVRSQANTLSPVLSKLVKGAKVTLLETKQGWYKIKLTTGKIGWVSSAYIALK